MFKRNFLKKVFLSIFCLITLLIIYLFPKNEQEETLSIETNYKESLAGSVVYLTDSNNYVSRVNISLNAETDLEKMLEIIQYMTVNGDYKDLIPNGFTATIPAGTKLLEYDLSDDGNLKLNFSKELLNVKKEDEMQLLESLIYSLTSLESVKSITILIEGEILNKLPSSSDFLPNPLDRSFGINKKYDIDKIKDTTKTTMYYLAKNDNYYYYVPVTKVSNENEEKIEIIIKELSSSPIYEMNLMSYLNNEVKINNFEVLNSELNIDFNNAILSDITKSEILEEVTYAINLSIKDNYDVESVSYLVNNEKIATFDLKTLDN